MQHILEAAYEGAKLELKFGIDPSVALLINGIERETASAKTAPITLKVGSPVQTGYEQHEFIEASVCYETDSIQAVLRSGDQIIAEQLIPTT